MADVHLPHLDDEHDDPASSSGSEPGGSTAAPRPQRFRSASLLKIALEVLLISTGVFLGLMGEQWRTRSEHRDLAHEALRRFRTEIAANRKAILAVQAYHVKTRDALDRYFAASPAGRTSMNVQIRGIQSVFFGRTAWDLALATQALTYVDSDLAFELSDVYTLQEQYANQTRDMMQATYLQPPSINADPFLAALKEYYGDIVLWEPALLQKYDALTPKLDRALGD